MISTTITPKEILELIDINPPYFAFEEILQEHEHVYATVPVQQPLGREVGPISAAEASRHLAILGVCSCALKNPVKKRHYYLAHKGVYERLKAQFDPSQVLTAKATCLSVDRRKAEAVTELMDATGETIIRLKVTYHVILDTTFERLYKDQYVENPDFKLANPYAQKHAFLSEEVTPSYMKAVMGQVPEYCCAGHFPNYPALPVAILVYNLFDMASRLTTHLLANQNAQTMIRQYEITADNLAFAGDHVELLVTHNSFLDSKNHQIDAEGTANGCKSIGKISMILEAVPSEEPTEETVYAYRKR